MLATKIRAAFAPCRLGTWPAPLEAHPALAHALGLQALWLKREDLTGGNKVRGLEFLLAGAPPRSVFVTIGATGSSHCLATARSDSERGDFHVLPHRQRAKRMAVLERTGETVTSTAVRAPARDVAVLELDAPGCRPVEARDEVDEGRLARAVRPDQPEDLPAP